MLNVPTRGFTFIEVAIVLAIVIVLAGTILFSLSSFRSTTLLTTTADQVAGFFADARSRTLAARGDSQYGVHVEADRTVLFRGPTYTSGAPGNETLATDPRLSITSIVLAGGGSDVVFERLTGKTAQSGEIVLSVLGDLSRTKTIVIQPSGTVSVR